MTKQGHHETKRTYIPYMGDHSYIVEAGFAAHGMPAEVLPPPDEETLSVGLNYCKGRECLPCFTITGDVIRRARQPDFDPARAIVLIPSATMVAPCLIGQYPTLQQSIFAQEGLDEIEILSPSEQNNFQGWGERPARMRHLLWQGCVAVDLLLKLLHEYRPYERQPGKTEETYRRGLEAILIGVRAGGGTHLLDSMRQVARMFEALPVDRSERRPVVGLVGDIYIRLTSSINNDIIRQIERMGGEVMLASMMEWVNYTTWEHQNVSRLHGNYLDVLKQTAIDIYQNHVIRKITRQVEHLLNDPHEPPVARMIDALRPYYDPTLGTETVMSTARAIDFAQQGLSGIIHVFPFGCMPGIVTASLAGPIRADLADIPWLDVAYDGQEMTNMTTRLEAFFYQVTQFHHVRMANNGHELHYNEVGSKF